MSITITNFVFTPRFFTVSKGTTVTWTNRDPTPHQVINDPIGGYGLGQLFRSSPLGTGETYSFTFTSTGQFPFHCNIHPSMTGKITVQ
ncbi:MAG: plastocyanin/azurin family copper-binding protein [Methanomicrobiales archaeon]